MSLTSRVPDIPQINPRHYEWRCVSENPMTLFRPALGAEKKWAVQTLESRYLYLSGLITLQKPCTFKKFEYMARVSWERLRFEYPEVAMKGVGPYEDRDIECEIPMHEQKAREWARRTMTLVPSPDGLGTAEAVSSPEKTLREKNDHEESDRNAVCICLHTMFSREKETLEVGGAAFSFRVDHQIIDGIGAYIIAGSFLKLFARALGEGTEQYIDWYDRSRARQCVPEPWVGMMNANQQTSGKLFEANIKRNAALLLRSLKSEWGLRIGAQRPYCPMSIQKIYSIEDSKTFMEILKEKFGPAISITHFFHAAMILTLLRFKAPSERPASNTLVSPLFVNGRRYLDLRDHTDSRRYMKPYIPMCRAIGAIEFRGLDRYILSKDDKRAKMQRKLQIACDEAWYSYDRVRQQTSLLTESFNMGEFMADAKDRMEDTGLADPVFLSDGLVEQYVDRVYKPWPSSSEQVFTVDDVKFTANSDGPPLVIRLCTFRDSIRLSAEWNGACYSEDLVRSFLDGTGDLMQIFTRKPSF